VAGDAGGIAAAPGLGVAARELLDLLTIADRCFRTVLRRLRRETLLAWACIPE
jgi:hypothetical protein